ncbi:UDP-N-acetylmuramate--L-alanine ligase [Arthrobacter sp. zg-Y820]|uniref:UDP-N-acetylmuramate--L-alanine ligase n=1 Tax=unclassified Arthrobacter TaxID=235627 RepID=UPI001E2F8A0A|nr:MULTISPECIES: UDP-N-acetylmuramate--L-alanine ligase [unclassified Arthrobacter]MCC9197863.1 UDP-N-acetylmuramate--L-alanine ligase [Arthrobacter sp. zg-Y820]MDK1280730.1 UDP-N-acetylmuramate--L-alanine ligase [Arthrobacter sp. zg.Y820]MDK1360928.1 UDP-N-acetylmuramate--L-alanine ligase [Arthrobacter sp. zg-Y1219]WIB10641.1 UDP-N-acetylmuramate--L-alanine ligase [Arthrobacter sp. zg-Y820]
MSRLKLSDLGRVHFIGLGGAGMSAVARVMMGQGVSVSGSDSRDSPGLRALEALGATVFVGQDAANVQGADTVVISTAIRSENPELAAARAAGLRIIHRSVALAAAMGNQEVVAVAGTHGKTTTTAMVTVLLREAGLDPSFAIGGDVAALGVNAAHGSGNVFVAEADESDGSFLNYLPRITVITNVEADHLDHYGTEEAVFASFDRFVRLLPADGLLVACADDPGAVDVVSRSGAAQVRTYGYSETADIRITKTRPVASGSVSVLRFSLDGLECEQELRLLVPGAHNIRNAAAAFAVGLGLGVDPARAAAGLAVFSGAARRFEAKGAVRGVRVFDDYAHHPTELVAALEAARTVAGEHRVHVLFQPHLFSRTLAFAAEFASALELADSATVLDIYAAREDPVEGVTSELITARVNRPGGYAPDPARAVQDICRRAAAGDIILTVGAGDVTAFGAVLVRELARTAETGPAGDSAAAAVPPASREGHRG